MNLLALRISLKLQSIDMIYLHDASISNLKSLTSTNANQLSYDFILRFCLSLQTPGCG